MTAKSTLLAAALLGLSAFAAPSLSGAQAAGAPVSSPSRPTCSPPPHSA